MAMYPPFLSTDMCVISGLMYDVTGVYELPYTVLGGIITLAAVFYGLVGLIHRLQLKNKNSQNASSSEENVALQENKC